MDPTKEITYNLRFLDINTIQFSQNDLKKDFNKDLYPLVEFESRFNFKVLEELDRISCIISVKIKILETDECYAELAVENVFLVTPLKSILESANGNHNILNPVVLNITAISISTIRGILHERFRGSIIHKEIYPLVDIAKLFAEDITVNKEINL